MFFLFFFSSLHSTLLSNTYTVHMNIKNQYIFPDRVATQNVASTIHTAWHCDITEISTDKSKMYIFIVLDVKTNKVIRHKSSTKTLTSKQIIQTLEEALETICPKDQENPIIVHTDRGGQFTSQEYHQFILKHSDRVQGSHTAAGHHSNQVIERFNRTLKEHRVAGLTLKEQIQMQSRIEYKHQIISSHIKDLNHTPNSKTKGHTAEERHQAIQLLNSHSQTPKYVSYSHHIGNDPRTTNTENIDKFQEEMIKEIITGGEFDINNLTEDQQLQYKLIMRSTYVLAKQAEEAKKEILKSTEEAKKEVLEQGKEILMAVTPKEKHKRNRQPLRDLISKAILDKFKAIAGDTRKRSKARTKTQIQTIYTILYYTGMRLNEARYLDFEDIHTAIQNKEIKVYITKTHKMHRYYLTDEAVEALKDLVPGLKRIQRSGYQYIFAKESGAHAKHFIRTVNEELKIACEHYDIKQNIKSHSFRIGRITSLLRKTEIQKVALIIGHEDIRSTLRYQRNFLDKEEITNILEEAEKEKPKISKSSN